MLLIGQVFPSVTYYRRENIPSTLIDNPRKVKEILKYPDVALDDISNTHFYLVINVKRNVLRTLMQSKNQNWFLVAFNTNLQAFLVEHRIITSHFALYPDSVPVLVKGISSERHPNEVRKTTVLSEKVPIRQDLMCILLYKICFFWSRGQAYQ